MSDDDKQPAWCSHGAYRGPNKAIQGRTAIIRGPIISKAEPLTDDAGQPMIMAQFDYPERSRKMKNPMADPETAADPYIYLCHGWHPFRQEDFEEVTHGR